MPNLAQLVQLGQSVGLPLQQAKLMAAIGAAESGGNAVAHNTNRSTGDNSYGIWQINMIDNLGPARLKQFGLQSNNQLFDPVTNAMAMKQILQGSGPHAWTTYTSGAYKKFLPDVEKAVAGGVPAGPIPQASFDSSQLPQQQEPTAQGPSPQELLAAYTKNLIGQMQAGITGEQTVDPFSAAGDQEDKGYGIRPLIMAG